MMSKERLAVTELECADEDAVSPATEIVAPRSGRRLRVDSDGDHDRLVIRAPDGAAEMTIRLTAEGPVVELRSASLELSATRDVTVRCQRFDVEASAGVELCSGERVHVDADAVELNARRGNVDVRANDDVTVSGERIFLNR